MTKAELLPCPFCGKPPKTCADTSYGAALVYCPDQNECLVGPTADAELNRGETLETAIAAWNTRIASSSSREDVLEEAARVADGCFKGHGYELGTIRAGHYEHAGRRIAAAIRALKVSR